MNRFLLITLLIFISGCASDFGFQGQSQNIVSISEFKFKSGISGNVPPGLCQIKELKSEREGYGVVFFSNCNPHTNNKSLVTLTYLNLGQTQSAGFFSEEKGIIGNDSESARAASVSFRKPICTAHCFIENQGFWGPWGQILYGSLSGMT